MTEDAYEPARIDFPERGANGRNVSALVPSGRRWHPARLMTAIVTAGLLLSVEALAQLAPDLNPPHHSQRLLIRFAPGISDEAAQLVNSDIGAVLLKKYRYLPGLYLVEVPPDTLSDRIADYLNNVSVVDVEPDYIFRLDSPPVTVHGPARMSEGVG